MTFITTLETTNGTAKINLSGDLDGSTAEQFKKRIEEVATLDITRLVLLMKDLDYLASAGLRVLIFAKQKMGANVDIFIVGAQELVLETIKKTGFHHSVILLNDYDES